MSWAKLWDHCLKKIKGLFFPSASSDDPHFVAQVLHGGSSLKKKYAHFKRIVEENDRILDLMAELSQGQGAIYLDKARFVSRVETLLTHTLAFLQALNDLAGRRYTWLYDVYERIHQDIMRALEPLKKVPETRLFYRLEILSREYAYEVGNKAANLAEARNALGLSTPQGLAVSAHCFQELLRENHLEDFIRERLVDLSLDNPKDLSRASREIRQALRKARLPKGFREELLQTLKEMGPRFWAVRSSAIGEDGAYSFAGQFVSRLNVPLEEVPRAYLEVVASLYEERALFYRLSQGLEKQKSLMAVLILEMIDARSSGVLYTLNPSRPTAQEMLLSAVWGLGKGVVSGDSHPDLFVLDRRTGHLKEEKIATKTTRVVPNPEGGLLEEEVPESWEDKPSLKPAEISRLYQMALLLEEHFKAPQDIEWCIDKRGWLYLLQTRPLKVRAVSGKRAVPERPSFRKGQPVSPGVACGAVFWLEEAESLEAIPPQAIVITRNMDPELAKIVPKITGLIALRGSPLTHLATILREFQVPAVVIPDLSKEELPSGQLITLDAFEGHVYVGRREDILKARREMNLFSHPKSQRPDKAVEEVLAHILPLHLTEIPEEEEISPEKIKTIHDLVRFVHEVSVREMFQWGQRDRSEMAHVLISPLVPMIFYVIDLEGGLEPQVAFKKEISIENVRSIPFLALWRGMSHPGVRWAGTVPFELRSFVSVVSRSFVRTKDLSGKAFVLISREYLNFHSRLAYHFAVVDSFCSERSAASNYVAFRFQGGGAGLEGRLRRLLILQNILQHLGFRINIKGDRLTAILRGTSKEETEQALDQIGRLMAYVRQMDMAATDEEAIEKYTKAFLEEDYSVVQR